MRCDLVIGNIFALLVVSTQEAGEPTYKRMDRWTTIERQTRKEYYGYSEGLDETAILLYSAVDRLAQRRVPHSLVAHGRTAAGASRFPSNVANISHQVFSPRVAVVVLDMRHAEWQ